MFVFPFSCRELSSGLPSHSLLPVRISSHPLDKSSLSCREGPRCPGRLFLKSRQHQSRAGAMPGRSRIRIAQGSGTGTAFGSAPAPATLPKTIMEWARGRSRGGSSRSGGTSELPCQGTSPGTAAKGGAGNDFGAGNDDFGVGDDDFWGG